MSDQATSTRPNVFLRALRRIRNWGELGGRSADLQLAPDLPETDLPKVRSLMHACAEGRGSVTSMRSRAAQLGYAYLSLNREGRLRFLTLLTGEFGLDTAALVQAVKRHAAQDTPETYELLQRQAQPPRVQVVRTLNSLPDGFRFLVDLRADLLSFLPDHPELAKLDHDLRSLFESWFDVSLLSFETISWDSPASLLEKIVNYEAVHAVSSWRDLKNRLEADRRCYGFFHPKIPGEPLIFVEVALTRGKPATIGELLDENAPVIDPQSTDTAIFYSISNTQTGLRGVSFGSFLLKEVTADLAREFPQLNHFLTLSPIPGFRRWLDGKLAAGAPLLNEAEERAAASLAPAVDGSADADPAGALARLLASDWQEDEDAREFLKAPLERLAAHYLLKVRRRPNVPHDPVARFHLTNGASVEGLLFMADSSERGMASSYGMMVNYRYEPDSLEANHERLLGRDEVTATSEVQRLALTAGLEAG